MICCLNPFCTKPINPDRSQSCRGCGGNLSLALRGRYRPIQLLGQGGFGRTYLALDRDRLDSRCVIKQFSPQPRDTHSTRKAAELFAQEAVRLHELGEHPQIPALLAYFEQDGYLYLVQQYIEGTSLAQELNRNGPFSEVQIRQLLFDVLPVLQFIHSHQVIHRDITPTNILRRRLDHRLVLIDFGVAKQFRFSTLAQPGTQIGTQGYSPIEQLRGGRAYPASDLYSLGATCIHLLTNIKPEQLYDPLNGQWLWSDYLARQKRQISPQLTEVLSKLLQDLVGERYQSAKAVWQDLYRPKMRANGSRAKPSASLSRTQLSHSRRRRTRHRPQQPAPPRSGPLQVRPRHSDSPRDSRPPISGGPLPTSPPFNAPPPPPHRSLPPISAGRSPQSGAVPSRRSVPESEQSGDSGLCQCRYNLQGHGSWITCLAVHPTTPVFASAGLDDVIKLWHLPTGELIATLTGHVKGINALVFSPDGQWLISGSDDFSIKIWDAYRGDLVDTLMGHIRDVTSLAVSPNSEFLLSGSKDRTIRVWSLASRNVLKVPFGVGSMIRALAASPDGSLFVSGGMDRRIKLWSFQTAEIIQTWVAHSGAIHSVAVSPDSQIIASAGKDQEIKLWNRRTGTLNATLSGHTREVNALAFGPDGSYLISGSSDRKIHIWDISTGKILKTLEHHADSVTALATRGQDCFISSGADKTISVWQIGG